MCSTPPAYSLARYCGLKAARFLCGRALRVGRATRLYAAVGLLHGPLAAPHCAVAAPLHHGALRVRRVSQKALLQATGKIFSDLLQPLAKTILLLYYPIWIRISSIYKTHPFDPNHILL